MLCICSGTQYFYHSPGMPLRRLSYLLCGYSSTFACRSMCRPSYPPRPCTTWESQLLRWSRTIDYSYQIDQALLACLVTTTLPPHTASQMLRSDVLDLRRRDLRCIVGDHAFLGRIIAPGCYGLIVVTDLCARLRKRLYGKVSIDRCRLELAAG